MWTIVAFAALGFLIGNTVGLTASSVASSLISLLFAFGGGSAVAFLRKLNNDDRRSASQAVTALSLACLVGIYVGIWISESQILTPHRRQQDNSVQTIAERKYLRSALVTKTNEIDQAYQVGDLTPKVAYEQLYEAVRTLPPDCE